MPPSQPQPRPRAPAPPSVHHRTGRHETAGPSSWVTRKPPVQTQQTRQTQKTPARTSSDRPDPNRSRATVCRQDSGYESLGSAAPDEMPPLSRSSTRQRRSTSRARPVTAHPTTSTSPSTSASVPSTCRSRPSARRTVARTVTRQNTPNRTVHATSQAPGPSRMSYFHFPSLGDSHSPESGTARSHSPVTALHSLPGHSPDHLPSLPSHLVPHPPDASLSVVSVASSAYPLPPPTTHYWTSDHTRRLEYAAIDAASRSFKGWLLRHVVPACLVPKDQRRPVFEDDTGSVRRYRIALQNEEQSDEQSDKDKDSTSKGVEGTCLPEADEDEPKKRGWAAWMCSD